MQSFLETYNIVTLLAASSDRYNGTPQSNTLDMEKVHRATVYIEEGASTGGNAAVVLNACTGSTGAGATAIAYRYKTRATSESTWSDWASATSTGVVTLGDLLGLTGFALQFTAQDIAAAGSSATFRWAQIVLTESVNTPIPAAVIAITEPRYYGQAIPASVDAAT